MPKVGWPLTAMNVRAHTGARTDKCVHTHKKNNLKEASVGKEGTGVHFGRNC